MITFDRAETKARAIILDFTIKDKELSISDFDRCYTNKYFGSESFYDFVDSQMPYIDATLAPGTVKFWKKGKSKLMKFRKELRLNEIDLNFLQDYERYMIVKLKNNENTRKPFNYSLSKALKNNLFLRY